MKLFITGGTGFIGKHVLSELQRAGDHEITVLSRKQNGIHGGVRGGVRYVRGEITDTNCVKSAMAGADAVLHFAGCKKDPASFYSTNVTGTRTILDACSGARVRKLIYLSSVGVIGPSNDTIVTERTPCDPGNEYERTKHQAEMLVKRFSEQTPGSTVILRPTNVFGEEDPEKHLLNLISKLQNKRFYYVGGENPEYHLNYLYVKEISGLIPGLLTQRTAHDLYILNTPAPLSEFIIMIKQIIGSKDPVRSLPYLPVKMLALCFDMIPRSVLAHPPVNSLKLSELTNRRIYANERLATDLNWKPSYTMQQALTNLITHYRNMDLLAG